AEAGKPESSPYHFRLGAELGYAAPILCGMDAQTAVADGGGSNGRASQQRNMEDSNQELGSILQRHAMVHLLLHLGIDVVAFDFDTFLFEDPRHHLETMAGTLQADVLVARHLDADCLNMGLLYVRSSRRTAEWYTRYFSWLHLHPYEREQRGLNSLLNFTSQEVSFRPQVPELVSAAVDDSNEFVSSRGGWLGDWSKLKFFHWVNPAETRSNWPSLKLADIAALYEAALHHETELALHGMSLGKMLGAASGHVAAAKMMRAILSDFIVAERPCVLLILDDLVPTNWPRLPRRMVCAGVTGDVESIIRFLHRIAAVLDTSKPDSFGLLHGAWTNGTQVEVEQLHRQLTEAAQVYNDRRRAAGGLPLHAACVLWRTAATQYWLQCDGIVLFQPGSAADPYRAYGRMLND
ncbi:unnamed protein product, partial [Symbiodinium pilosum]